MIISQLMKRCLCNVSKVVENKGRKGNSRLIVE